MTGALTLPTEKSSATLTPETAKVLLYGDPKIGKTTLAASVNPDRTLFIATEPGHGAMSLYKMDVGDWARFREVGALLAEDNRERFDLVVIDTVDELAKQCQDAAMAALGATHPSELEYGKGWDAVKTEFKLRVGKLCSLGLGVWFISHAKGVEVEQRIGKKTVYKPDAPGFAATFLGKFVDHIFFYEIVQTDEGEQRQIRTQPSEFYEAGGRVPEGLPPLADPIPLPKENPARGVREAMAASYGVATTETTTDDQAGDGQED